MTEEVIVAKNRSKSQKGWKWPKSTNNAKMAKKTKKNGQERPQWLKMTKKYKGPKERLKRAQLIYLK